MAVKFKRLLSNREIKNAGWIISGTVFNKLLAVIVGILTAYYM